jgi:hypothetical protein
MFNCDVCGEYGKEYTVIGHTETCLCNDHRNSFHEFATSAPEYKEYLHLVTEYRCHIFVGRDKLAVETQDKILIIDDIYKVLYKEWEKEQIAKLKETHTETEALDKIDHNPT